MEEKMFYQPLSQTHQHHTTLDRIIREGDRVHYEYNDNGWESLGGARGSMGAVVRMRGALSKSDGDLGLRVRASTVESGEKCIRVHRECHPQEGQDGRGSFIDGVLSASSR